MWIPCMHMNGKKCDSEHYLRLRTMNAGTNTNTHIQLQLQLLVCTVRSGGHTCTKRPTIKMTMWLFECELMYSLSVFTSRHPTIRTYFTQITIEPDHMIATKKTCFEQYADEHTYGYFWIFFQGQFLLPKSWCNTKKILWKLFKY